MVKIRREKIKNLYYNKIYRGEIKILSVEMYCGYCSQWKNLKRTGYIDQEVDGEESRKAVGTRNCLLSKKKVGLNSKSCEYFDLYHNFWCYKNAYWQHIEVCAFNQNKKYKKCLKCKQKRLINNYLKYFKEE